MLTKSSISSLRVAITSIPRFPLISGVYYDYHEIGILCYFIWLDSATDGTTARQKKLKASKCITITALSAITKYDIYQKFISVYTSCLVHRISWI